MKIPLEFRLRYLIHLALFILAFNAPWNYWLHLDTKRDTWAWLDSFAFTHGWHNFQAASISFLVLSILLALLAALLRTAGTAYLGASTMQAPEMRGDRIVAAGPYRFLRNPLYLGIFLHTLALALLMPPSGAIFAILAIGLFELRLIASEEHFLTATLGQSYLSYKARVPRLFPALTPRVPASAVKPAWLMAFVTEIYFLTVPICFAALGWRYDRFLLLRCVLISLGVSIIVRALLPKEK